MWPLAEDEEIVCSLGEGRLMVDDTERAPVLASGFNAFLAGTKAGPRRGFEHPAAPVLTAGLAATLQGAGSRPPWAWGEALCGDALAPPSSTACAPNTPWLPCPRLRPEGLVREEGCGPGGTTEGRVAGNSARGWSKGARPIRLA